ESDPPGEQFLFYGLSSSVDVRLEHLGKDVSDWGDEPTQLSRIKALGPSVEVYAVHFSDVNRLRAVLCRVANSVDFLIDDDFGLFVDGQEFRRRCEGAPNDNGWWLDGAFT